MTYLKLKELTEKFNWQKKEKKIRKKFIFKSFDLAVDFFNLVVDAANAQNHHPDILSSYCSIEISLTTHDEKKITEKDLILASKIDELFDNFIANEK
jgi:4a-hydroxytetrahydrobiopterin dehydratase|tara:strand:+ start:98 stop:388 length:291 start_codon:yes stop_codon:yes gene_type:complete